MKINIIYIVIVAISLSGLVNGQDSASIKKVDSLFQSAVELQEEKDYYLALLNYHYALALSGDIGYSSKKSSCLNNIGVIYKKIGDYQNSLIFYSEGIKLFKVEEDSINLGRMYLNVGKVFRMMQEADSARHYFNMSLEIFTAKSEYKYQSKIENEIGITYEVDSLSEMARSWYRKSLTTAKKVDTEYYKFKSAHIYNNIGWSYFIEGNDSCQTYYNKSLQYVKFAPNMAYYLYSNLSELYKDTDMEIYYLEKTVESYNTKEIHLFYIDALSQLSSHYTTVDAEKSKSYSDKLSQVTREQFELSKKVTSLNEQYQVKAAEERLKKEDKAKELAIQERNNTATYIGSAILFSLIVILLLIFYQKKKRRIDETLEYIG